MTQPSANENAFLGAIVGTAIGDALGLPVDGMSAAEVSTRHGRFQEYLELPGMPQGQPTKGVISDKTEFVLSIIESLTTNEGVVDPENIIARMRFIIDSPSRMWISDAVATGIEAAFEHDGVAPDGTESPVESAILSRGIPIGLLHSVGQLDLDALMADAAAAARSSSPDEESVLLVAQVAQATSLAARFVDQDPVWKQECSIASDHPLSIRISEIVDRVIAAETFEDAVLPVVQAGGGSAAFGAIVGGIAGARFGAAGLPQQFIDDLDARIYLSMAAPWFYRTVLRRQGLAVNLQMVDDFPR